MMDNPQPLLRRIRRTLGAPAALGVALRLLLARRLQLELEAACREAEARHAEELSTLLPEEWKLRIRGLVRDRVRSYPRTEDRLERMEKLPEPARLEALIAHLSDFSGGLGERLRDPAALDDLRALGAAGEMGAVLEELLALRIGPEQMDAGTHESFERSVYDLLRGGEDDGALAEALRRFEGGPMEERRADLEALSPDLSVVVEHDSRINWAMERNGIPIVHAVRLKNTGATTLEELIVRLQVGPDLSPPLEVRCAPLAPGASCEIDRPDLRLDGLRLRSLVERETGALHIEARDCERLLLRESRPVHVLAFNEWDRSVLPELLAAFVLPNDPSVARVLDLARDLLRDATGDPSLAGYQTRSRDRVRKTVDAVYRALQRLDITYVSPPASFDRVGQKVRFPDQVLEHRMGTCLDLTVLLAAALEQCGLHPLLALTKDHAFPGVWLVEDWMRVPSTDDALAVRKLAAAGELLLFDSATVTARPPLPLAAAEKAANDLLSREGALESLIDVRASRLAAILPLPVHLPPGEGPAAERPAADGGTAEADGMVSARGVEGTSGRKPHLRSRHRRIEVWKERLLDLSLHNRLLNYRESRERSVALDVPELNRLEDRLAAGGELSLEPRVKLDDGDPRVAELLETRGAEELIRAERLALLEKGRILTRHDENDLSRRLLVLFREARTELEETGSSTLYMAIGFLRWFESESSDTPRLAPILLHPVQVIRPTARARFRLRLRDDEPRLNDTLLEKLRVEFGLEFPELKGLPLDDAGADVGAVLTTLRRGVARVPRFEVLDEARIAFFSFAKFLMWRDLAQHEDDLLRSGLVRHLVGEGSGEPINLGGFLDPRDLDEEIPPSKSRLVLDADSSQHVAVDAALKGRTFVLQGPPGTGKSQTITNIIAESLAAGRRVLFVAEKRAALEVVAKRLRAVGLGDFCLELHSNKARKREVVLELARVEEIQGLERRTLDPGLTGKIEAAVRRLNAYTHALHAPAPLGLSHFQCAERLHVLASAPRIDIDFPEVLATPREVHEGRLELLSALRDAARELPGITDHPLAALGLAEWTALRARQCEAELRALASASDALTRIGRVAGLLLGIGEAPTLAALERSGRVLALLAEGAPPLASGLVSRADRAAALDRLAADAALLRERASLLGPLGERFDRRLLATDLDALLGAYRRHSARSFLLCWWGLRKWKAMLLAVARRPLGPPAEVIRDLDAAARVREIEERIAAEDEFLRGVLGAGARGVETDFEAAARLSSFVLSWVEAAGALARETPGSAMLGPRVVDPPEAASRACDALAQALETFRAALDRATAALVIDHDAAFGAPERRFTPEIVRSRALEWLAALPLLRPWTRFVAAEERVRAGGLATLVQAVRSGVLAPDESVAAYERAFFERWVEHSLEASPELRAFNGREHDRVVETFCRGDVSLITSQGRSIASFLENGRPVPAASVIPTSEAGILQREARKKTRHMAIRRLFAQIPNLLPRLKPCLLMSPLSITQYLPPSREPFDLVIFDEASQIPTHDAIGAIARGHTVVVVGDSKQLPPTAFFATSHDPGEEEEDLEDSALGRIEELESILDECVASHVPSLMLRWHYRSRDERLIAFSNRRYYADGLLTFPAAAARAEGLGVSLVRVEGVFDRGKTRTNRIEAERVVERIVEALRDPARRGRSLGVVTFNQPQQSLIEDLLDEARRRHPEIEPYFGDRVQEPVFVKNLENVQGDERDDMLFSVTYGPDPGGRVSMNFGPLNLEGGERRLNVAVTRARLALVVFASMGAESIDLSRTRSVGAAHLKSFLSYAELGPEVLGEAAGVTSIAARGPLEEDVFRRLAERGHLVERQVGCSGYRVDLAVRDREGAGRFVLGIECDGATYRSGATARDRDRLRRAVLEGLGWRMHRTWSVDWWHDPDGEVRRIEDAIALGAAGGAAESAERGANAEATTGEAPGGTRAVVDRGGSPEDDTAPTKAAPALQDSPETQGVPEPHDAPGDDDAPPAHDAPAGASGRPEEPGDEGLPPYRPFRGERLGTPEDFEDPRKEKTIADLVARIVEEEGPLHRDLLCRRAASSFDIGRVGKNVEARLQRHMENLVRSGRARSCGFFLWPVGEDPDSFTLVRGPDPAGEVRDADLVPPEELGAAVLRVLHSSVALSRADLARGAAALMGYRRLTVRLRAVFDAAIDGLMERGLALLEGDSVRVPRPPPAAWPERPETAPAREED
ncbi:MAG TPA: DUF3320 domain-containing protein [Planctomycetota bacterium]|nr:DUF3320 domain-containing protein [Planctomycetota bacterium]